MDFNSNTAESVAESNVIQLPIPKAKKEKKPVFHYPVGMTELEKLVHTFLTGEGRKMKDGCFFIDGNRLAWRNSANSYGTREYTIALKIKRGDQTVALGNSSTLEYVGGRSAYGHFQRNRNQTAIQGVLEAKVAMIPFTVFEQAKLKLSEIKIIDQTGAETVRRKFENPEHDRNPKTPKWNYEAVHFTGASLFECQGSYFIFDIDRREIDEAIFNPFVAKLPRAVKTIAEAYQSLKPKEVLSAEKRKIKVLRQGEWFFIETKTPVLPSKAKTKEIQAEIKAIEDLPYDHRTRDADRKKVDSLRSAIPAPVSLRAGQNRPNEASTGITLKGISYVSGLVKHTGREHADLNLGKKWWRVIPNTAIESFQISGDVD